MYFEIIFYYLFKSHSILRAQVNIKKNKLSKLIFKLKIKIIDKCSLNNVNNHNVMDAIFYSFNRI